MRHLHRFLFVLTTAALGLTSARAEEAFAFESTPGQLPKEIVPRQYAIRVIPNLTEATFAGSESIQIEVTKPVRAIVLNAMRLEILKATLQTAAGAVKLAPRLDPKKQTLTFPLDEELAPGRYQLDLEFKGQLNERPQGLYFTRYKSGADEKRALATQMEPTDARRMFPCWDEPVFRATFQLTATIPSELLAVSNMPIERERAMQGGLKEVAFLPTPPMASYLVVLCAAEFEELRGESDGIPLRILTTPGKRAQASYAMEATRQILPFYHAYFGTGFPLPKLDQIALNNMGASGMENWGAILYDETALLFDPQTSSQATKERVFAVVAHELAHQWFGDLVTMAWWDNLWLNEGFASWMGAKATAHFNPQWKTSLRAAASKERAMRLDARATTHPIQQPIANESQAGDAFDAITYSKGEAFLRMLESWLGEEDFRQGIRKYIGLHSYSNSTTADLWVALEEASHQPVREMAAGWVEQPGFPIVQVGAGTEPGTLRLTQRPFTIHQNKPAPRTWQIPIVLSAPKSEIRLRLLLGSQADVISITSDIKLPIKINAGDGGYYRAGYDADLLSSLLESAPLFEEPDRFNLLNDSWALVQAGTAPVASYLQLAATMLRNETSYPIIEQVIGAFAFLDELQEEEEPAQVSSLRALFRSRARALLRPHLERIGFLPKQDEDPLNALLRGSLIPALASFDDAAVIELARSQFAAFLKEPGALTGDLRRAVISVIGAAPVDGTWEALSTLLKSESSTEQQRSLQRAMAGSRNARDAEKTLALTLTNELIPADAARLVQQVAERQPKAAWEFARQHLELLHSKVASFGINSFVPGIFRSFSQENRAKELELFARENLPEGSRQAVAKAADEIRFKAEFKTALLPSLGQWIEEKRP